MSINLWDNFYINKYKELLKEIENLNMKNVKGYSSFFEYVLADQKMIKYFKELKRLEKKCDKIKVDSYETFENNIFEQLKKIYQNKLVKIFEIDNCDEKISKLNCFKNELEKCFGYGTDKCIAFFINDIDDKIKNINRYIITDSSNTNNKSSEHTYNVDILKQIEKNNCANSRYFDEIDDDDEEDPLLNDAVESVIEVGQASTSFIQRKFKVGYARAGKIIDQMEARGIISGYEGSKPRQVLITMERWNELKSSNSITLIKTQDKKILKKLTDEEYEVAERAQMSYDEKMKLYGIDTEYDNNYNISKNIHNFLIIESMLENDKNNLVNTILKYQSPEKLKTILIGVNSLDFIFYNDVPHMLIPVVTDISKIIGVFMWILQEINDRLNLFVKAKSKDIITYNEKNETCKLPEIVVIIDEIYEILSVYENKDALLKILLNCERTGIKLIMFSKFSKKNLNMGSIEDLVQIYVKYSPNLLSKQNYNQNDEIKKIDIDMNGFEFEKYVGELLYHNGFEKIEITQKSVDFGVDVIAYKDDIKYSIQCKKYSSSVGIKAVQEVIASKTMNNSHVAVVITNNYFSNSAKELAKKNNVLLWDRDKLIELINKAK